jgi:hypothetical protein
LTCWLIRVVSSATQLKAVTWASSTAICFSCCSCSYAQSKIE